NFLLSFSLLTAHYALLTTKYSLSLQKKRNMASVKNLKKDINYVLGDIIDAVLIWELTNTDKDTKESQKIIDLAIQYFDELVTKVNDKKVENKKQHFKAINQEL